MKLFKKFFVIASFVMILSFYQITKFSESRLKKETLKSLAKRTTRRLGHRLPGAIIAGTSKSGTRVLLDYIDLHPKIVCKRVEAHFFDRHYNLGIEWYRKQMPVSYSDQITIEKTPDYFQYSHIPELVYRMNPIIKLIVIVRNPVKRAISEFTQIKGKEGHVFDSDNYDNVSKLFEETVFDQNGNVNPNNYYIKNGLYVEHMKNWLRYFPSEQIHVADGEKIIIDPYSVVMEVEKFLNVDPFIKKENFVYNKDKGFMCLKELNTSDFICQDTNKGRKHPFIPEQVQNRIKEFYKKHDEELFKLLKKQPYW
jgi:hypothetical protein